MAPSRSYACVIVLACFSVAAQLLPPVPHVSCPRSKFIDIGVIPDSCSLSLHLPPAVGNGRRLRAGLRIGDIWRPRASRGTGNSAELLCSVEEGPGELELCKQVQARSSLQPVGERGRRAQLSHQPPGPPVLQLAVTVAPGLLTWWFAFVFSSVGFLVRLCVPSSPACGGRQSPKL